MIWNKKNKQLLVLLTFLSISTLIIYNFHPVKSYNDINRSLFVIDTAQVNTIQIIKGNQNFNLFKNRKTWFDQHKKIVNQRNIYYTLSILSQNHIKRLLTPEEGEKIHKEYKQNKIKVIIDDLDPFYVICNDQQTQSYWTTNNKDFYSVGIEGYNTKMCDAFNLDSLYWKNNYIFNQHLRYLKSITFNNPQKAFKNYTLTLNQGKIKLDFKHKNKDEDLVRWMQALSRLEYADYVLKTTVNAYDSLLKTKQPLATLVQNKLLKQTSLTLNIYPKLKGDPYHVVDYGDTHTIGRIHKANLDLINNFKNWTMTAADNNE